MSITRWFRRFLTTSKKSIGQMTQKPSLDLQQFIRDNDSKIIYFDSLGTYQQDKLIVGLANAVGHTKDLESTIAIMLRCANTPQDRRSLHYLFRLVHRVTATPALEDSVHANGAPVALQSSIESGVCNGIVLGFTTGLVRQLSQNIGSVRAVMDVAVA